MFSLEKSGAVSLKIHRGFFRLIKSWKLEKIDCSSKTAGNRPEDPILAEKSISWPFQCVPRIALKVHEVGEKWIFVSPTANFFEKIRQNCRPEKSVFCYLFLPRAKYLIMEYVFKMSFLRPFLGCMGLGVYSQTV